MNGAIWKNQPVNAETAVVGLVAEIAAVGIPFLTLIRDLPDALVHPVPDETALQTRIGLDDVPVLFEVAGAVAHRMGIFGHDEGAGFAWRPRHLDEPVHTRIHRAHDVYLWRGFRSLVNPPHCGALIKHRAPGIVLVDPVGESLVVRSISGLVTQRP